MHAADLQDADGAGDLLRRLKRLYCWLRVVFADSVYDRLPVLLACFLLGLTLIVVRRLAGSTGFVLLPCRWLVERRLAWFARFRRLATRYERRADLLEAFHHLAAAMICCRLVNRWSC